ncbi:MAG: hypothetical protein ACYCZR_03810 [Burkholderiales bacterium]
MDKEIGMKPSREEVLKAAHEFECLDEQHYGSLWADRLERFAAAMYEAGAAAERAVSDKLLVALQIAVSTCFTEYALHSYMSDHKNPIRELLSEVEAMRKENGDE